MVFLRTLFVMLAIGAPGSAMTQDLTMDQIDARLSGAGLRAIEILKTEAPDDYRGLVLLTTRNQGDGVLSAATTHIQRLEAALSPYALIAPDKELQDVLRVWVGTAKWLSANHGPEQCRDFIHFGTRALDETAKRSIASRISEYHAEMLEALYLGRDSDSQPKLADADAYGPVIAALTDFGAEDGDFEDLAAKGVESPHYCRTMIAMHDMILHAEGEAGEKLRAETIVDFAAP